ncbi:MAG TPA: hypothetical protein VEW25_06605 [Allosphingosinicella sp.]|nr:hypothetical protein [Allosphingosinicella sp.]
MPQETITVYIRESQNATGVGYHSWAIYTNAAGQSFSMSGWAGYDKSIMSPVFGTVQVQVVPWGPRSWDWSGNNNYSVSQQIAAGADLSSKWSSMVQCAEQINAADIQYAPLGANSNAVINTCLLVAGLPQVTVDSSYVWGDYWTPGGELDLRSYFDTSESTPFGPLNSYAHVFGSGFDGARFTNVGFGGGGWIGGTSGRWVLTEVQVGGAPATSGWRWVEATATRIKPVVLDLDGDGIELTGALQSPGFDFFATGHIKTTGWFYGGDAMLIHDGNGNGVVDHGAEISFLHHSPTSTSDLDGLRALDSNGNGSLDAGDASFNLFRLWTDTNFNGISDPGELQTLAAHGITSLSLQGSGGGYSVNGNDIYAVAGFTRSNGTTGSLYDVGFEAFSRGSKLVAQSGQWALIEMDTGERIGATLPVASAVAITDLANYSVHGVLPAGLQLTDQNDSVATTSSALGKGYYIDSGAGADTINLSYATKGNVIKSGAGDDIITGSPGNDWILPGSSVWGDTVYDGGGDDHYLFEPGFFGFVSDYGGTDVAMMMDYNFADLSFSNWEYFNNSVFVGTSDGLIGVHFEGMYGSSAAGIEYLILKDRTVTRDEMIALANSPPYYGMYGMESSSPEFAMLSPDPYAI